MAVRKVGEDASRILKVTCHECGSILEYLRIDVKKRNTVDYSGVSEDYYWIDCPCCQNEVPVRGY